MSIKIDELLSPFREILNAICGGGELSDVFHLILTRACALAEANHGSLMYVDYESQCLPILCAVGDDWSDDKLRTKLKIGEGVTGIVAQSGKPYLCHNTEQYSIYVELFPNVKSEMAVPVIIHGKVWAVINIDSDRYEAFGDDAAATLRIFADLVAFAMQLTEPDQQPGNPSLGQSVANSARPQAR